MVKKQRIGEVFGKVALIVFGISIALGAVEIAARLLGTPYPTTKRMYTQVTYAQLP